MHGHADVIYARLSFQFPLHTALLAHYLFVLNRLGISILAYSVRARVCVYVVTYLAPINPVQITFANIEYHLDDI